MNHDAFLTALDALIEQVVVMQWLEVVAVVLAIAYVLLAAKKNIWCWLCAGISTALYTVIFWDVNLPFQVGLNGYYVLMAVVGFVRWKKEEDNFEPTRLSWQENTAIVLGILLVTLLVASYVSSFSSTSYVYVDAFVTVASVVTTLMVVFKKLDNWVYWVVINAVSCWLYWQVGLVLTSLLFLLYVGLAVYGLIQWLTPKTRLATQE
ncbi:nicotinamide riboside transporter PnuC [Alteromonas facilis]|uniref:nicotinamide riboside transporter PnuC n=1 Tax=Alteromonas facilis TaxID=2048004 RepID=UPI001F0B8EB8|nr:nicotinamide riboside transporter PnuC [Alteromonas facilis]